MTDNEDADDVEFRRKYGHVKRGYVVTGLLFVAALVGFIIGIATGVGSAAGVGGIFLLGSFVALIATGVYHALSGVWDEQERRQRYGR